MQNFGFTYPFSTPSKMENDKNEEKRKSKKASEKTLAFVDYEKAFDSIETWVVLNALQRCQIDYRYIEVLKYLYRNANMSVRVQDQTTEAIPLQRGVRQGDVISSKLFTNAMEDVFKLLDWEELGININSEYISHLRFSDDIVVMANVTINFFCQSGTPPAEFYIPQRYIIFLSYILILSLSFLSASIESSIPTMKEWNVKEIHDW